MNIWSNVHKDGATRISDLSSQGDKQKNLPLFSNHLHSPEATLECK